MSSAPIRITTVTLSDTRTTDDDLGGKRLGELLSAASHTIVEHRIVREDPERLEACVRELAGRADVDAIVTTGGTGLGPRDNTVVTLEAMFDRKMVGFGESFRRLSWDQVGARSMLSNATAGVIGTTLVFALPGSPKALDLAVQQLIVPVLGHAVDIVNGRTAHAKGKG